VSGKRPTLSESLGKAEPAWGGDPKEPRLFGEGRRVPPLDGKQRRRLAGFARQTPRGDVISWAALLGTFALAGPVFVSRFNLPLDGAGPAVAERFYLMPEVVLTVMAAVGLDAVGARALSRPAWAIALTAVSAAVAIAASVGEVLEYDRPTVALYVENTLRGAPPQAIVVGTGDHRWGAFMYARYALHLRSDVVCVVPDMVKQPWYRAELGARLGVSLDTPDQRAVGPKTLMRRLLSTGRPVLYTDWPDPAVNGTRHYSVGTLMRVLRDDEAPPAPDALEAMNEAVFSRYEVEPDPPRDPRGWGRGLIDDYARAWGELGQAYGSRGEVEKEQACFRKAARFAPWLVSDGPSP
jgi:hypothetical protein